MSGGGTTQTSQTTTQQLSPEQRKLLDLAMPFAENYAANPVKLPTAPLTSGFDPAQTQGQNMALGAAGQQQQVATSAGDANKFLLEKALYPETNPALSRTIDAAVRPLREDYAAITAPGIRNEAAATGNFGGSRQGVAEGIAMRSLERQIGDTSAKVANEGYQGGLDAMVKALGLSPQTADLQVAPAITTSGVGEVRQNQSQNVLNEAIYRALFPQQQGLATAQELAGLSAGVPGGSTVSTGTSPRASPFSSALGGASLGSAILPGWGTAIGGGLGALLGLL